MDHVETVSLGVWVATGARHEHEHEHGISHLLEHMAFKGTRQRSAQAIAEEIESIGGDLNAATSMENTAYYARVLKGDEGKALEVLADILQDSVFDGLELRREQDVIVQEIAAAQDSPDDLAYDLMHDAAYPGQAVGRTILGTPQSVAAISGDDLKRYLKSRYIPEKLVISAAGAVDHEAVCRHAEALFGALCDGKDHSGNAARYVGGVRAGQRPFEQSHLVVGFEGPSYRSEDIFAVQVLSGLLGGGMSSRLFQEAREKRGLCYAIYSTAWGLSDSGMFVVHAASGPEMLTDLVTVIGGELKSLAVNGPAEAEVNRAKAQLKSGLLMGLESSAACAEQMARHLIVHDRLIGTDEIVARVDAVDVDGVGRLARQLLSGAASVAVVGAGEASMDLARQANEQFLPADA